MPIKTSCPHCNQACTMADHRAGKKVRCAACANVFPVPAPSERPDTIGSDSRRHSGRLDDRPGRNGRKRVPLWVWLVSGAGLLLVGVVVLVVVLRRPVPPVAGPDLAGPPSSANVTSENADKLLEGMTVAEADAILGPGKICTLDDIGRICAVDVGPQQQRPEVARVGDESSWRLWQNGGLSVMVGFRRGKSGVERVSTVARLTRLPSGAIEFARTEPMSNDLDAVAAARLKYQQLLLDARWKTGAALRAALVGKWRSPRSPGWRKGWDFNADGTCTVYSGEAGELFVQDRGKYYLGDDTHIEIETVPRSPQQNPERYRVLVDDKELVLVDDEASPPELQPAMQRQR
jgi:hypothetical protein